MFYAVNSPNFDVKSIIFSQVWQGAVSKKNAGKRTDGISLYFCNIFRDPLTQMAEEKREHDAKMKKMEAEMEQVFEMKVKEKKQKLKDSEADVRYLVHTVKPVLSGHSKIDKTKI